MLTGHAGLPAGGMVALQRCDMHALLAQRGGPRPSTAVALDTAALGCRMSPAMITSLSGLASSLQVLFLHLSP